MPLSAWAVEGSLEIVPVAIFGAAGLAGALVGWRMYRTALPEGPPAGQRGEVAGSRPLATSR